MSSSTIESDSDPGVAQEETPTVDVTMPDTGADEGVTLVGWLVEPGQPVEAYVPICVVSWHGTTAEVGSPATGVLRQQSVGAGVRVSTGTSLALIDTRLAPRVKQAEPEPEAGDEPQPLSGAADEQRVSGERPRAVEGQPSPIDALSTHAVSNASFAANDHQRVSLAGFHSPAVRRLATELEIDVEGIPGTGASGRVTLQDVRAHARTVSQSLPQA